MTPRFLGQQGAFFFLLLGLIFFGCGSEPTANLENSGLEAEFSFAGAVLNTIITSQPTNPSNSTSATFKFKCNKSSCTFNCRLDGKAWKSCTSPKTYKNLKGGAHSFKVKATNTANGKIDKTPAGYDWTIENFWVPTSTDNPPSARERHTGAWTGTEMIIWGGEGTGGYLNTGKRYNPSTNSWTPTSTTNAPVARFWHTALWTGEEMIIWGGAGGGYMNSGGKYNPSSNSWTATSTISAPSGRYSHSAIWTGTEMIVWGGNGGTSLNTGGRYDLAGDSWTATSTTGVPLPRQEHTAVWTGAEMIIWGGYSGTYENTGGKYDPSSNSWVSTTTNNVPTGRTRHTAVWTGTEMIIWGGYGSLIYFNDGARFYPPTNNSWVPISTTNAPTGRENLTSVWTGTEMIVWGGWQQNNGLYFNTGGKYNPTSDSWSPTSTVKVPSARSYHTAVWTGTEMIIWGGYDGLNQLSTGGRYVP